MSTCKELAAKVANASDPETKAKLQEKLSAREKTHRDALKSREKALRGKDSVRLAELFELLADCEAELPNDDSILKRVRASVFSRESHIQETYEAKLTKKNITCRTLEEHLAICQSELGTSTSKQSIALLDKLRTMLESRQVSHKAPLEREVANTKGMTMKELARLKQRVLIEVGENDSLAKDVLAAEKARDADVRSKLMSRFKDMIKDLKKTKTPAIQSFLDECLEELDENDALLAQVRSTLENKMLESKGMKPIHDLDAIERGDREKLTDDLPTARGKKSKAESSSTKKKSKSSSKASSGVSTVSSIVSSAMDIVSGFRSDLSGAPPLSTFYKLGIIVVFLLYVSIVYYSTSLTFKVTKVEVDVSKLTGGFTFPRSIADTSAAAIGAAPAKAAAPVQKASAAQASPPQASASAASKDDDSSNDNGGGGGDDDDD